MREFEALFIVKPSNDETYVSTVQKYEDLITSNEGTVLKTDLWGVKRLAYEIQDFNQGYYVLTTFASEPKTLHELDRVLKLDENILRHMIIRKGK